MDQSWGGVEKLVAMEGYEDFADTGVRLAAWNNADRKGGLDSGREWGKVDDCYLE